MRNRTGNNVSMSNVQIHDDVANSTPVDGVYAGPLVVGVTIDTIAVTNEGVGTMNGVGAEIDGAVNVSITNSIFSNNTKPASMIYGLNGATGTGFRQAGNTFGPTIGAADNTSSTSTTTPPGAPVSAIPGNPAVPIYRFFSNTNAIHFFTASYAEGISAGMTFEMRAFSFFASPGTGLVPVYRCFYTYNFISTSPNCEGTTVIGQFGYLASSQVSGTVPLYRIYNPKNGDFIFSLVSSEGATSGYTNYGAIGYVSP